MNFINNMTIRGKLLLLLLFPMAGLFAFSINGVWSKYAQYKEMGTVQEITGLAVNMSSLVHDLQKERGMSAVYLGSKGTKMGSELPQLRQSTDRSIENLKEFLRKTDTSKFGSEFKGALDTALSDLEMIKERREAISSLSISPEDGAGYYTKTNASYLNVIGFIPKLSTNSEISNALTSYVNFLDKKERSGQERAVMSSAFAVDKIEPAAFKKFSSHVAAQETYARVFLALATPEQRDFYNTKIKGQVFDEVARMRNIVFEKAAEGKFGVDAVNWYNMKTAEIDVLKEVEDKLSKDLHQRSAELQSSARSMLAMFTIMSLAPVLLVIVIGYVIISGITHQVEVLKKCSMNLAACDLRNGVDHSWGGEMGVLATSFNKMSGNLRDTINNISKVSSKIASSSQELSATSEQMSKGMREQSMQASQIASAMEEMNATVLEVAKSSREAASSANAASAAALKGGEVVSKTVDGMKRIAEMVNESSATIGKLGQSSDQIGEIVTVIEDIADQTNLLALNAAIEAARAGEQGRGFAVVADEVRKLAERTTRATKEIGAMIKNIQKETVGAVKSMERGSTEVVAGVSLAAQAGDSLSIIVDAVHKVNHMISQIATAAEQQSSAAEQISRSVENVASHTKDTASGSHQTSLASNDLAKTAIELNDIVIQFKI